MVMLGPDGRFLGVYGKDHPVIWMGETSVTGGSYPVFDTPFGTLGTIICYDLNFTGTARNTAANGAQLIAVGSNDWPGLAPKQYTNLVMRAVENRVALVKADGAYDSAIIDPTGRIVSKFVSASPSQALLLADVAPGSADAPLVLLGDWVGWACIAGIAAFAVMGALNGRRERREGAAMPDAAAGAAPLARSAPMEQGGR
jgi:apolipoprotein N-acyltransferase